MKATLICRTPAQLEHLRKLAAAEGVEVVQSLTRAEGAPLAPLLEQAQGEIVAIDCSPTCGEAEVAAIEAATRRDPALHVLLLGATRDPEALLAAMRAGVREVLPARPQAAELAAALHRIAAHAGASASAAGARTVAFISCKGGSGATFLAANVAWVLATEHHARTLLLDLDLQSGDAAYFLCEGGGRASVADLAHQGGRLDASLLQASTLEVAPGLRLLPAPEDPDAALGVKPEQIEAVLQVARGAADIVVLDVERMLDPVTLKALDAAERIYLVTENMVPHARDAKRLVRILRTLGYPDGKLRLVVNKVRRHGIAVAQVEEVVGLEAAHVVQDGEAEVAESVNTGTAIAQLYPRGAVARDVRAIATGLAGPPPRAPGWFARLTHEAA